MRTAGIRRAQPYVTAFDGLRALAVIAVVAYHASLSSAPGGFFGVDVFFVISGYLVTALLLDRATIPATSDLLDFWRRRVLRLAPAAGAAVLVTFLVFALVGARSLESLSLEAAGALGYVANWLFLLREQSYFETAASPSPFLHFWSLAVEGQFYLLWPLLMVLALRGGGRLTLFLLAISLAAISVVVGSSLYDPFGDPSRAYYGTDARAAGLLMGAALGVVARPGLVSARGFLSRPAIEALGWGGALVLVWLITRGSEFRPFTYQGGFLVASAATIAVMLAGLHARNSVAAILSVAPLRWIGLRSYSIYLCHWPVVVLTQPQMSSALQSWNLAVARFAATLILAEISYRLVEYRFRTPRRPDPGTAEAWWRHPAAGFVLTRLPVRAATGLRSPWAPPAGVVAAGLLAILIAGGLPVRTGSAEARTSARFAEEQLEADGVSVQFTATPDLVALATAEAAAQPISPASQIVLAPSLTPSDTPSSSGVSSSVLGGETSPSAIGTVIPLEPDPAAEGVTLPDMVSVTAIGDSVMVGAVPALAEVLPGLYVDAEVGRQFWSAAGLVTALRDAGELGDVVVIHLGSNGPFTSEQFEGLMAALDGVHVIFVNVTVPRRWEGDVNEALAQHVAGRAGASLADWYGISHEAPDFFASDGVHLTTTGMAAYAGLIDQHVRAALGRP